LKIYIPRKNLNWIRSCNFGLRKNTRLTFSAAKLKKKNKRMNNFKGSNRNAYPELKK